MKRLTERSLDYCTQLCSDEDAISCAFYKGEQEEKCWRANMYDRLAAYEDTGLEPEEVKEITSWSYGPFHKKMGDWLKAEHEGRLIVLPCKVGDLLDISRLKNVKCRFGTLYHIDIWDDMEDDFWLHADNGETVRVKQQDIGKTVFLTRAEAEKAMEVSP